MPANRKLRFFSFIAICSLLIALCACIPPGEKEPVGVVVDLNDATTQRIYDYQNDRNVDSLLRFLADDNPSYRYLAARAFGSYPELPAGVLDSLLRTLQDENELVRSAAAYTLGAVGDASLVPSLAAAFDTSARMNTHNATLLAAIGKVGGDETQRQITAISTYRRQDTLLRAGRAWGLFYFARRGVRTVEGDSLIVNTLLDDTSPADVLKPAAYYAQRFPFRPAPEQVPALRAAFRNAPDPDVTMAMARLLGKSAAPEARITLARALAAHPDWRVRVEILQSLADFDYALTRGALLEALRDDHPLVRKQAANLLIDKGAADEATAYHRLAKDSLLQDVQFELYAAANRHLPAYLTDFRGRINYDLLRAYQQKKEVYERAAIIGAMGEYPWNYRTIYDLYTEAESPVTRTAAAQALRVIANRDDFDGYFQGSADRVRRELANYFQAIIESRRVGPAYFAANAITASVERYRPLYPDVSWLGEALGGFELPKEIEAYYAVAAARAALIGDPPPKPTPPRKGALDIDWKLLAESGEVAVIRTSAGKFSLRLLPEVAPATVTNFIQLVQSGYYEGKVFHRVVPNFVAQGGGPLGDGFGAEGYIVRTETPGIRWDRPGLVGMASAGRDTEGVQFFLTHRATPHLNGEYTIFAEVTDGQEVVDRLTVGTRVESIILR